MADDPRSVPMLDPIEAPTPADLLYAVLQTGLPNRDRKMTLLQLLKAFMSDDFESFGTFPLESDQPITNIPAWRNHYPDGTLQQGWLNLRDALDPISADAITWDLAAANQLIDLGSYSKGLRVRVTGTAAAAKSFTFTGNFTDGREILFFVQPSDIAFPCTIKQGGTTIATIKGGELVRVHFVGGNPLVEVVAAGSKLGRASDLTWLTGPILESWFEGLGWEDAETPGWTGDDLKTVLNAFGPTYQEAAAAAAAARKLSEEVSAPFGSEACAWVDGVTLIDSDDALIPGIPCRAVRVRGYAVDNASPTTSASISLSMALTTLVAGSSPVEVNLLSGANAAMDAFIFALVTATEATVPAQFYAKCILRDGAGNIRDVFARLLIAGGLTPVVQIWFYSPTYTHAVTWDELGTMFPGGGVVLQLHETFTIPAPIA